VVGERGSPRPGLLSLRFAITLSPVGLRPMLARAGELPIGDGWAYEVKWDGFRAIVSTEGGLRVRAGEAGT